MTTPIVVEHTIGAAPAVVYSHLTESVSWARWQGAEATIEATPGGFFGMTMATGMRARGQFVELVEDARVVFTWGWVDHPGVPPGSSTVEIDLIPVDDGTLVRLTHRDLNDDEVPFHELGWGHYLPRLAIAAEGGDPGPDLGPAP